MTKGKQIDTLEIFEDLYRANMRASLYELENCMMSIEMLPKPKGHDATMVHETLRHFMLEAMDAISRRLAELRTRYEALPKLPTKKGEVDDAS